MKKRKTKTKPIPTKLFAIVALKGTTIYVAQIRWINLEESAGYRERPYFYLFLRNRS